METEASKALIHLAFELRAGRIASVKEYVDTAYANERLMGARD